MFSQDLFSSFEMGAGLSKTILVDNDKSVLKSFNPNFDFSKQWQGEAHVSIWETEKFEYDFGISLTKSFLDYGLIFRLGTDIMAGAETKVLGSQENWDVDISGGIFYKLVSNEKSQLSVGPEVIYRKTIIGLINESVTSDTIVDPAIHDVFNGEGGKSSAFGLGAILKYAYMIKPNFGIYLKGFGNVPMSNDTVKYLGIEDVFRRLHAGISLGVKIRIKP